MRKHFIRLGAVITALTVMISLNIALAVTPSDYSLQTPENLVAEHLYCESALLVDAKTGEILFTNNSRVRMFPASTTKIATLYVGLTGGIGLDEVITVPKEAADIESDSSKIPVKPGDRLTWRDLLYSFMMTSGNDGANAIAVLTSGSIPAFVEEMNAWVQEIGCAGTHFTNAHGLHDENHYTTAQDLALMTRVAMENETFRDIVACAKYNMKVTRKGETVNKTVVTRNNLLIKDQKYYYADCIGVKTGHTNKAGYCFVGAAERDGMEVISVVLNCREDHHKWYDSAKLFEYGFTRYEDMSFEALFEGVRDEIMSVRVRNAIETDPYGGEVLLDLDMLSDPAYSVKVVSGNEVSRTNAIDRFAEGFVFHFNENITAPVNAGDVLGSFVYTDEGGREVTANLKASRSVEKQPDPTPTPEPTREPLIVFGEGSGRLGDIIMVIMILFAVILILGLVISAVAAAKRRKKRRMMEMRRREQLRRQAARRNARANDPYGRSGRYNRR